jgi:hypothetical protein
VEIVFFSYVWFENDLMLHVTSHVGPEDTLSYNFSRKEERSERGVFSYIPKSSPSFLKKNAQVKKGVCLFFFPH